MADKIRFHLNEHIGYAIARGLRQRGIEVTITVEAELRTLEAVLKETAEVFKVVWQR